MASYPKDWHQRARELWQAGKKDAEIARTLGVGSPKTIRAWRKNEKWEEEYKGDNLKIVRRAIKLLAEKIFQQEVKGSFADLNRMVRLKSDLESKLERMKGRESDQAMSDEQLDKKIEETAKRIASLERKKAKGRKG